MVCPFLRGDLGPGRGAMARHPSRQSHAKPGKEPPDGDLAKEMAANTARLTAANARVQADFAGADRDSFERRLLDAIINEIPERVYAKDSDGRFVLANRALAADFGLAPDDVVGRTESELSPTKKPRQVP